MRLQWLSETQWFSVLALTLKDGKPIFVECSDTKSKCCSPLLLLFALLYCSTLPTDCFPHLTSRNAVLVQAQPTYSSLIRNCNPRRGRGGHLPPPIGSSNRTALVDTRDSVEPEPRRDQHQRVRRAHQHAIPASSRDTHVFIMLRRIGNFSRRRRFRFELDFERSSTYGTMDMFKTMVSLYSNLDYRPLCVGGWRVGAGFNEPGNRGRPSAEGGVLAARCRVARAPVTR